MIISKGSFIKGEGIRKAQKLVGVFYSSETGCANAQKWSFKHQQNSNQISLVGKHTP